MRRQEQVEATTKRRVRACVVLACALLVACATDRSDVATPSTAAPTTSAINDTGATTDTTSDDARPQTEPNTAVATSATSAAPSTAPTTTALAATTTLMPKDGRIHTETTVYCTRDQSNDSIALRQAVGERLPMPGFEDRPTLLQAATDPAAPVVLLFHGSNGCIANLQSRTDLDAIANRNGVSLVWLSGKPQPRRNWNTRGNCCSPAARQRIDEAAYLDAVMAALRRRGLEPKRVITAGVSLGAGMALSAACQRSEYIDGAVSVAGSMPMACRPPNPMSLVAFGGTADAPLGADMPTKIVNYWRAAITRCAPNPAYDWTRQREITTWTNCTGGTVVRLASLIGIPHVWPHFSFYDIDEDIIALALDTLGRAAGSP